MKKVLSAVLALALVVSMFTAFTVSFSAAEPASYTGGALTAYRNELLNAKFGDWAWLDGYNNRSYPGYDSTIWGFICDDIDAMDYLKNNGGTDSQGRAAIELMNIHLAVIGLAPASYTGGALSTLRNAILCAKFGGNYTDYTTWAWLAPYQNRAYPGYDNAKWGLVCDDIDAIDAQKNSCTDAQGRALITSVNTHIKSLAVESVPASENTVLESSSAYYFAANKGLQDLLAAGTTFNQNGPAAGNVASVFFAFYYNYYYARVTLPENQAKAEAVTYKATLDKVYNWMYGAGNTGKVFYGYTDIANTLESQWNTMRLAVRISNGLKTARNTYMTDHSLWDNNLGKYTAASWSNYWSKVEAIDTIANTGTDAQCNAAYDAFVAAAGALVETGTLNDPIRKAAYDRAIYNLAGKPLYMWYVDRAYNLFLTPGIWTDAATVQAFLDKAYEADTLFLEAYDNNIHYEDWFPAGVTEAQLRDDNACPDMLMEGLWANARRAAYIGPILPEMRYNISNSIGDASLYTPESYEVWQTLWTDASNLIDSTKNNGNSIDQDGYDAVQACKDTLAYLEPLKTANATYKYYADQIAKLGSNTCDFVTNFNALANPTGLASDFDAAVKALFSSYDAARKQFVFGLSFKQAVDKLAVKYAADANVLALCQADQVTTLANQGTVAECSAYLAQINAAIATVAPETVAKINAKEACFGESDRGSFKVNYKVAYNNYKALVTLPANQGTAYNNYCTLLDEYNAAFSSTTMLTVAEYEQMRLALEQAWWSMRLAAGVGLIFQSRLATAAAAGNQAQKDYVAGIEVRFYSIGTDAQIADVWAHFNSLA